MEEMATSWTSPSTRRRPSAQRAEQWIDMPGRRSFHRAPTRRVCSRRCARRALRSSSLACVARGGRRDCHRPVAPDPRLLAGRHRTRGPSVGGRAMMATRLYLPEQFSMTAGVSTCHSRPCPNGILFDARWPTWNPGAVILPSRRAGRRRRSPVVGLHRHYQDGGWITTGFNFRAGCTLGIRSAGSHEGVVGLFPNPKPEGGAFVAELWGAPSA